ncbi:MAG: addiction module protein [Gemmatimonadaceae bacterium]
MVVVDDETEPSVGSSAVLAKHKVSVQTYFDFDHSTSKAFNSLGNAYVLKSCSTTEVACASRIPRRLETRRYERRRVGRPRLLFLGPLPDISAMATPAFDFEALRRLPVADRLKLVGDLWDSIAEESPDEAFPMTPELAAELDRRLADADAHPEGGMPWEEVRANILRRHAP